MAKTAIKRAKKIIAAAAFNALVLRVTHCLFDLLRRICVIAISSGVSEDVYVLVSFLLILLCFE